MGIILTNIRPISGGSAFSDAVNLRIEGDHIHTISPDPIPPQPGDEIVDGRGRFAFPGFINMHTHLPMVLFRGLADDVPLNVWLTEHIWPHEARLTPDDIYWCSLLAMAELIRGGTIGFVDMYMSIDRMAYATRESGLRGMLSYGIIADRMDEKGHSELAVAEQSVRACREEGSSLVMGALGPHAVYTCAEDVIRESVALAESLDVPMHVHVSETRDEATSWREKTGESPVEALARCGVFGRPTVAAHCVHVDEKDIEILAKHGVTVAHCPKSNGKLGSGIAPIAQMKQAGVDVSIGTDGAASNNRLDMFEEMRHACFFQRARQEDPMLLAAADVLAMATENGRKVFGLSSSVLDVGAEADVVLVDSESAHLSPPHNGVSSLVYSASTADITDVIVAGRFLLRNRELLTIDEEKAKAEAERALRR